MKVSNYMINMHSDFQVMKTNLLYKQTRNADPRIASNNSAMAIKVATTVTIMSKSGNEVPSGITSLPGSKKCVGERKCMFSLPYRLKHAIQVLQSDSA